MCTNAHLIRPTANSFTVSQRKRRAQRFFHLAFCASLLALVITNLVKGYISSAYRSRQLFPASFKEPTFGALSASMPSSLRKRELKNRCCVVFSPGKGFCLMSLTMCYCAISPAHLQTGRVRKIPIKMKFPLWLILPRLDTWLPTRGGFHP